MYGSYWGPDNIGLGSSELTRPGQLVLPPGSLPSSPTQCSLPSLTFWTFGHHHSRNTGLRLPSKGSRCSDGLSQLPDSKHLEGGIHLLPFRHPPRSPVQPSQRCWVAGSCSFLSEAEEEDLRVSGGPELGPREGGGRVASPDIDLIVLSPVKGQKLGAAVIWLSDGKAKAAGHRVLKSQQAERGSSGRQGGEAHGCPAGSVNAL